MGPLQMSLPLTMPSPAIKHDPPTISPLTFPSPAIKHDPPTISTVEQSNTVLFLCCSSFVLVYTVFLRPLPHSWRWPSRRPRRGRPGRQGATPPFHRVLRLRARSARSSYELGAHRH